MPWPRNVTLAVIALAIIGLADASYLTWKHYAGGIPPCTIHGCETVLTSKYATIGPIPVSLLGGLYYATVLGLALSELRRSAKILPRMLLGIVTLGLAATAYLVYLQGFVIHAWCQYCLLSAVTTAALWMTMVFAQLRGSRSTSSHV